FTLTHDGSETLSTTGRGFTDALWGLYDRDVAGATTTIEHARTIREGDVADGLESNPDGSGSIEAGDGVRHEATFSIDGCLVYPSRTRASRDHVYVAINGRPVRNRRLRAAVIDGYGSRLPSDRYPIAVVRLSVPPELVDPNVHPAKRRVALAGEASIAAAVADAIDTALSSADDRTMAAVPTDPDVDLSPVDASNPFETARLIGTFRDLYLLCEVADELLVVDQHAAHERVLYERFRAALADEPVPTVDLDPPATVSLSAGDRALLAEHESLVAALGFSVTPFGGSTVRIASVPAPFGRAAAPDSIRDVLDDLASGTRSDPRDDLVAELACHPSVKAGDRLSADTARTLLDRLGECANPYACPHGRPTVTALSESTLARAFDRRSIRFE
ncbi:MAG: DNA mismatch repair endonuclease MutL, partial [Halobacteriota archaeon]